MSSCSFDIIKPPDFLGYEAIDRKGKSLGFIQLGSNHFPHEIMRFGNATNRLGTSKVSGVGEALLAKAMKDYAHGGPLGAYVTGSAGFYLSHGFIPIPLKNVYYRQSEYYLTCFKINMYQLHDKISALGADSLSTLEKEVFLKVRFTAAIENRIPEKELSLPQIFISDPVEIANNQIRAYLDGKSRRLGDASIFSNGLLMKQSSREHIALCEQRRHLNRIEAKKERNRQKLAEKICIAVWAVFLTCFVVVAGKEQQQRLLL